MKKMLLFAKPYWKTILFSFLLTGFIVIASLAQPYLIKIAIDSHINGLYSPMVVLEEERSQQVSMKQTATLDGQVYYRVDGEDAISTELESEIEKSAIVSIKGTHYLIHGWNEGLSKVEDYQLAASGKSITLDGAAYPVQMLTADQVDLFRSADYTGLIILGAVYFLLIVGSGILSYYQNNSLQYTGQSVIYDIRQKMMKHLSNMQMDFYGKNPIGRLVTRITHDVEALNQLYSQVIVNLIKEVLMLVGIVIIMLQMSVKLTLVSFIVIPVIVVITFYFKKVIRNAQRYVRLILSRLNTNLAENLSGMKVIQIFAREKKQLEDFQKLNDEHYRAGMRQTVLNSIFNPSIGLFGNISLALIVWYGGRHVLDGAVTFGVVYAFTSYVRQFFEPLRGLADRFNQIQASLASAERIFDTLEEKPTIINSSNPQQLPERVRGKVDFNHVWFAYQDEEWVLKDVHFNIKPGETIGIVGATGAGKSSIIQLINRFYDIQKGEIRIDDVNIKDVTMEDLRKHIGIIQQDSFVFSGTVYDNIRLNNTYITNEEIIHAAKSVNIDEFFRALPNGYETILGEDGVVLSTGQKQLLSFLRAILAGPNVLILDEATANIDTETEMVVQDTLKKVSENRTTIIIAHRLATIQHADKIIVLDKGQIIEVGNHPTLLAKRGAYYRLCHNQNKQKRAVRV
ncbi:ABC transporter ATP-binding protein [Litchfieldia alkalitelluris]|uniref:ABC transporter ATP-binding protein n=1 Tax=Litchfieldia alkalitelluris TaxID=304268 RepID=UPI001F26E9A6|nr:ABC transporter ATP-binding protein [Litchfieldia alkalitelluris]